MSDQSDDNSVKKMSKVEFKENSSNSSVRTNSKRRVSQYIVRVPIDHFNRIKATDEVNSLSKETQLFVVLIRQYQQKPTASQVSFILPENGMTFPAVTICKYNSIRQSYVKELNETTNGSFSYELLQYLALSYLEIQLILTASNEFPLQDGEQLFQNFIKRYPNFSINHFFKKAGSLCNETLRYCSFVGREFDCCKYAKPILTDMGLCHRFEFSSADVIYLRSQTNSGVTNGLQIIADSDKNDQAKLLFDSDSDNENVTSFLNLVDHLRVNSKMDVTGLFSQIFDSGFRYFVHSDTEYPSLSTEGITYLLLPEAQWGNCTKDWPTTLQNVNITYSSAKCKSLCRAKHYYDLCGCSPFIFNVKEEFPVCSAYKMFQCIEKSSNFPENSADLKMPNINCLNCKLECDRWVYHTYNSYGEGFSEGALDWLRKKLPNASRAHIKNNFVAINIFYRDMAYTQYEQMQSITFTEVISNIGGSMGISLGMSFFSIIEIIVYFWKASWILLSKKRRKYLIKKKFLEEQREKTLEQTLEKAQQESSSSTFRRIANSIRRKISKPWSKGGTMPEQNYSANFTNQVVNAKLRGDGKANIGKIPTFAEIKLNAKQLSYLRSLSCPDTYPDSWNFEKTSTPKSPDTTATEFSNASFENDDFDVESANSNFKNK
uniref:Uncharacterized protein n=1 Tax=Panagrolaimus sp. PS1159 TaxID=55785 RepID=A0AC35FMY2_9BILA